MEEMSLSHEYPIGTRILIEVEVVENNCFSKLLNCLYKPSDEQKFIDLTGSELIKIYKLGSNVRADRTMGEIIDELNKKYIELKERDCIE